MNSCYTCKSIWAEEERLQQPLCQSLQLDKMCPLSCPYSKRDKFCFSWRVEGVLSKLVSWKVCVDVNGSYGFPSVFIFLHNSVFLGERQKPLLNGLGNVSCVLRFTSLFVFCIPSSDFAFTFSLKMIFFPRVAVLIYLANTNDNCVRARFLLSLNNNSFENDQKFVITVAESTKLYFQKFLMVF